MLNISNILLKPFDSKLIEDLSAKSPFNFSKWLWNSDADKDPLAIPLHQKVAFGISLATLGYQVAYGDAGSTLGTVIALSHLGLSLYQQIQSPSLTGLAGLIIPFTPLRPLSTGLSSLQMGLDVCKHAVISLSHLNGENYLTVARNLLAR